MPVPRFWIRKDREQYFLMGVIITCAIGGFVSSYWHFSDRLNVRKDIKINVKLSTEQQQKTLRETQYAAPKLRVGSTVYYRIGEETRPSVPRLGEDE